MARSATLVSSVLEQTSNTRTRWMDWFFGPSLKPSERAIRSGRLVRALRFYADKAKRHHLSAEVYGRVCEELDRLLREPTDYEPNFVARSDRAFIYCPDFAVTTPEELFPGLDAECRVWLFGPDTLPDKPAEVPTEIPQTPDSAPRAIVSSPVVTSPPLEPIAPSTPKEPTRAPSPLEAPQEARPESPISEKIGVPIVPLGNARGGQMVNWSPSISSNPHLMIAGLPGMGKTTCLINICQQLVAGNVMPIVFSYHDDIDEKLATRFPGLSSSDGRSLGFNPMRVTHDGPLAHVESAGQLRDIFAAIFPDSQGHRSRCADLGQECCTV